MLSADRRTVALRVGAGLRDLAGSGRPWAEPALARKAVVELLGVFPATHVEIELAAVAGDAADDASWGELLAASGHWKDFLAELWQAISDGAANRVSWGIALPDPRIVAAAAEGSSTLKSGLQLASFLRSVREASLRSVTLDAGEDAPADLEKALAPSLRNAQLYGWTRAISIGALGEAARWKPAAEIVLVRQASAGDLAAEWNAGNAVGGGLGAAFWAEGEMPNSLPASYLLWGSVPETASAKLIVERGRALKEALAG